MKSCDICQIIAEPGAREKAAWIIDNDDSSWLATLRIADQALLGTCFITFKRHVERVSDLVPGEWQEFKEVYDPLERAVTEAFGASVVNLSFLMNHAFRSPDPSPHVHAHFKPRYPRPVEVNGQVFTDPGFGDYLSGDHKRTPVDDETAAAIIAKIKEAL